MPPSIYIRALSMKQAEVTSIERPMLSAYFPYGTTHYLSGLIKRKNRKESKKKKMRANFSGDARYQLQIGRSNFDAGLCQTVR